MSCGDDRYLLVYTTAVDLLECVRAKLALTTSGIGRDMRVFVSPGMPTDEDCCKGQLAVYVVNMYPSRTFPEQDATPANCGSPYTAVTFGVRVTRCIGVPGRDEIPTPIELQASAAQIYEDAYAMWIGARCCLESWASQSPPLDGVLSLHQFFEPEAGCVGSELQVIIGLTDPCGCG